MLADIRVPRELNTTAGSLTGILIKSYGKSTPSGNGYDAEALGSKVPNLERVGTTSQGLAVISHVNEPQGWSTPRVEELKSLWAKHLRADPEKLEFVQAKDCGLHKLFEDGRGTIQARSLSDVPAYLIVVTK